MQTDARSHHSEQTDARSPLHGQPDAFLAFSAQLVRAHILASKPLHSSTAVSRQVHA